ncbi:MAG: response regulator transcription factor [Planctomycetes bacterium]|nr:response regulator transcription factor [Planctomycetota bacterium]
MNLVGRMKIRSAPGRGSAFVIAIPDGTGPVTRDLSPVPRATEHEPRATLRVLLVDDHQVMREGSATLLNEQEDIEVVGQAANGQDAVRLTRELQPDVVVMDVAMPVMAGDEATRQIKQAQPRTRIVGLSMFDEPACAEKMQQAGAECHMPKTAPSEDLLAAIRAK